MYLCKEDIPDVVVNMTDVTKTNIIVILIIIILIIINNNNIINISVSTSISTLCL